MAKTATKTAGPDLLAGVDQTPAAAVEAPKPKLPAAPKPAKKPKTAEVKNLPATQPFVPPPSTMIEVLARVAADPRADAEKTRAFLDMQKEIMAEQARIAFTESYIAMQAELPVINAKGNIVIEAKAGKRGQKTPYATFNEINRVTKPIMGKFGFALWFEPDFSEDGSRIVMRGHLDHSKGHGKVCAISLPLENSGSKNNVQGIGSSISYGKRYAAIALLNLSSEAPEDIDDDGKAGGGSAHADADADVSDHLITAAQLAELNKAIKDCGVPESMVCVKYGEIEKLADLPARLLPEALKSCATFKKNKEDAAKHG